MTTEVSTTTPNVLFGKGCSLPFPTRWFADTSGNTANAISRLQVTELEVKYVGAGANDSDAASIRTDNPVPSSCPFYYFEITVANEGMKGLIGVGFSTAEVNLERLPGWDQHSYGYHGDDGHIFPGRGSGTQYGPTFTKDDVIGCYWNRGERTIGYTKNGIHLGIAFRDVPENVLYPTVGFRTKNEEIRANFGSALFVADYDAMIMEQRQRVEKSLNETEIKHPIKPVSGMVADIILEYLIHHRYPKTAAIVASEMFDERPLNEKDEAAITARQRIYEAVLSGNVDEALSQTDLIAPGTFEKHPRILFKLRCQRLVQMVQSSEEDTHAALQFGRTFLSPSCSTPEDHAFLSDVLTLIAYDHPSQSPCGHLLNQDHRRKLAEELNNAILETQGRCPRSSLETIYKQLFATVDVMTELLDLDCQFLDFEKMLTGGLLPEK